MEGNTKERLGRFAIAKLKVQGYVIKSQINGDPRPELIDSLDPYIVGFKGQEIVIVEVVLLELLEKKDFISRLKILSKPEANRLFRIIVRESEYDDVLEKLDNEDIYVDLTYSV